MFFFVVVVGFLFFFVVVFFWGGVYFGLVINLVSITTNVHQKPADLDPK